MVKLYQHSTILKFDVVNTLIFMRKVTIQNWRID